MLMAFQHRDVGSIIEKLYGNSYSPTTISNITDVAIEEINKWRQRKLNKRYSVLFIDAMSVKLRRIQLPMTLCILF